MPCPTDSTEVCMVSLEFTPSCHTPTRPARAILRGMYHIKRQYCRFCGDPLRTVHESKEGLCASCLQLRKDVQQVLRKRDRRIRSKR